MNKIIIITTTFFLSAFFTNAQTDYKHSLSGIKKVVISSGASMQIVTGETNELIIGKYDCKNDSDCDDDEKHNHNYNHNHNDNNNNRSDKSKGLKAIYSNGVDNTGFGISIEKDGDILRIKDLKSFIQRSGIKFTLPKTMDISVNCGNLGAVRIENFASEIEVQSNVGHIHLVDVTGPITANSSTGGIDVEFISVSQKAPITISTATASVDVTIPENTNADLVLKSTLGTVYTNFDLNIKRDDGMKNLSGNRKIVTKLNNGGVKITLSSSTGNVYLRKRK
jgi:hypothetical protein